MVGLPVTLILFFIWGALALLTIVVETILKVFRRKPKRKEAQ